MSVNYYEVLGITNKADSTAIKRAYRRLSLENHPDRNVGAESKFKQIVEAYATLSDETKRRVYDKLLSETNGRRGMIRGDEEYGSRLNEGSLQMVRGEDTYNHGQRYMDCRMAHRLDREGRGPTNFRRRRLEDIQQTVCLSMEECYKGTSVPIEVERIVNGVKEKVVLYLDVPEGTDNGEVLVMEDQGNVEGNDASHVRMKVVIDKHDVFTRDKLNAIYHLNITLKEALCGYEKEIVHLDGKKYVIASEKGKIMSQRGRLTINGKGFRRGPSVGNLVIVFNVMMPKSLTTEQLQTLEEIL